MKDVFVIFSSEKYVSDAQRLHEHVLRLNHDTEENGASINCMKISFDHEYPYIYFEIFTGKSRG